VSFFLAAGGRPVTWEELQDAFPAYAEGSPDARQRKFERDKAELLELGVPVEWVAPTGGEPGGYVLPREQYYLRDLSLAPEELTLLTVAGSAALQQPDFPFRADLVHALDKLLFVQPAKVGAPALPRLQLQRGDAAAAGVVEALGRAVAARKNVTITYRSFHGEVSERIVSPWGLAWRRGAWFLVGHCHLRGAPRTFQAERIVSLAVNAARPKQADFEVPADFDVAAYVGRAPWQYAVHGPVAVEIALDPAVALLAQGRFGPDAAVERTDAGGAVVRLAARNTDAVVREVLSLAPHAAVIAPADLRARLRGIASAIAGAHLRPAAAIATVRAADASASRRAGTAMAAVDTPARRGAAGEARAPAADAASGRPPAAAADVRGLPSPGSLELQERIRRALFLIPWAVRHRGCTVEELAAAAHLTPDEVLAEIDFLRLVGRPPFSPAEMVDIDVIEGRVEVFLPQGLSRPPSLTPLEAAALDAAASALAAEGGEALASAREKLRAAVPPPARARFDDLAGRVRLAPAGLDPATARLIDRCIAERRELEFTYWTAARAEAARRRVRPLERVLHQGYWYLHAWCCDRRERRLFRLDRAVDFAATDRTFVPRAADDAARFAAPSLYAPGERARPCTVRIAPGPWATQETARRLGAAEARPLEDGGLDLMLHVDGAAYPVAAVLALAGAAELIEPADLRERVAEAAAAVATRHG